LTKIIKKHRPLYKKLYDLLNRFFPQKIMNYIVKNIKTLLTMRK